MKLVGQGEKVLIIVESNVAGVKESLDDYSILNFNFQFEDYKVSVLFFGGFCELEFYQTDDGYIAINGGWVVSKDNSFEIMNECMKVKFQKYLKRRKERWQH